MGERSGSEPGSVDQLRATYDEYRGLLVDGAIPADVRRADAKHMAFWQRYCADVVRAVSDGEKPVLAHGTYARINERAQVDYEHYTDRELAEIMDSSVALFLRAVGTIDADIVIPYKAKVRGYSPSEYVEVMENHYRMHVKHLTGLRSKVR